MKLSNRELMLAWTTGVVVLYGLTYIASSPKFKEWGKLRQDQQEAARQIRKTEMLVAQKPKWDNLLVEQRKKLSTYPPEKDVSADMLMQLDRLAAKNGISIPSREVKKETPHGDLYELSADYKWEGNLQGIVSFLFELQQENGMLDASQLSISPNEKRVLRGGFTLDLAYCRPGATRQTNEVRSVKTEGK